MTTMAITKPGRAYRRTPRFQVRIGRRVYPSIGAAARGEGVSYDTMWRRVKGRAPGGPCTIPADELAEFHRRIALELPLDGVRVPR